MTKVFELTKPIVGGDELPDNLKGRAINLALESARKIGRCHFFSTCSELKHLFSRNELFHIHYRLILSHRSPYILNKIEANDRYNVDNLSGKCPLCFVVVNLSSPYVSRTKYLFKNVFVIRTTT